ncbi:hypothetical protein WJX79_001121 [Trebouxia sp. C0005]
MIQPTGRKAVKGFIFDMDGTLTVPVIDFAEMRRRCGVMSGDVLDTIADWPAEKQLVANQAIREVEQEALQHMQLMPGLLDLCSFLEAQGLPRGLVTRNVDSSVKYFHDNHFSLSPFWPALSREFKPYKPNPGALLHICQQWGIPPEQAIMVGDSAKDDVVAGNRAGMDTILIDMLHNYTDRSALEGELKPSHIVTSLAEIPKLLQTYYCLERPAQVSAGDNPAP